MNISIAFSPKMLKVVHKRLSKNSTVVFSGYRISYNYSATEAHRFLPDLQISICFYFALCHCAFAPLCLSSYCNSMDILVVGINVFSTISEKTRILLLPYESTKEE